ncbi:Trk system potassium transporter TrkA [Prevotella lacticifex]|uniref:Trk system potassium uptake protein TrkA n=1 Tax=Prevotella lacticifex TaxID=2854755 RepID=A0A9R1CY00_9BACT|nr:Trk system potassium transporter TrkA [Prevotella lacticifex]GJG35018.1 Trk system potassium transport protein TrkA [Prevotella lacticifex]GJG39931.1 Trk system potassium transport protein TrkA [Prevotella lacticifex]GJG41387.1 Trk system potassium transport protein TrkA [Prevotella lacticifex]GJG46284.1 Trk system potassium transport protein TrkA [Prevotella lacticifex]GJG47739.1 Trk system potassium transport protein TrkA [Prevotella lacticifex]
MKVIIAGASAIGSYLAKLLSRNDYDITILDEDEAALEQLNRDYDLLTLDRKCTSPRALRDAGAAKADLFIAVTADQTANLTACTMAHALGAKKTVAKVDDPEYTEQIDKAFFKEMGIDSVIYPEMLAAKDIINGLKMSWVRQRWDVHNGELVMLGIKLREGCEILNQPLKDISGPDDPYHIVAIKRGADTIIPGGNDSLKLYDLAYFMTTRNYIPYIRKIVGKEHYADVKNVMIMGGGNTAVRAVKMMPEYMNVKVLEKNKNRCEELNEILDEDTLVINGDGRDMSLLVEEGIRNTQAFVALTPNAETNILACLTAKRMGVRKTVAMVENVDYVSMAESLDIGTVINKKITTASYIYQMLLDTNVYNIRFLPTADADVAEFIPAEGSKITRKPVKDLGLPTGITIGGLVRDEKGMLVSGNTQIQAGDSVVIFAHKMDLKNLERLFK